MIIASPFLAPVLIPLGIVGLVLDRRRRRSPTRFPAPAAAPQAPAPARVEQPTRYPSPASRRRCLPVVRPVASVPAGTAPAAGAAAPVAATAVPYARSAAAIPASGFTPTCGTARRQGARLRHRRDGRRCRSGVVAGRSARRAAPRCVGQGTRIRRRLHGLRTRRLPIRQPQPEPRVSSSTAGAGPMGFTVRRPRTRPETTSRRRG